MENYVSQQLMTFARSILLGMGIALVYDLLRPVRQRCPGLLWLLDGAYCLASALGLGLFLLRQSGGELRLYILLGAAGGVVLFFSMLSEGLQAVWEFWAETVVLTGRILAIPVRQLMQLGKKTAITCKNLFYFAEKCYTIRKNGGMGNSCAYSGGRRHGAKQKKEAGQGKNGLFYKSTHRHSPGSPDVAAGRTANPGGGC
ncbi:MAG: hypothetical protein E7445_04675 [Ruminococcaceae bacterium]|nr:hypothetical protein [Oscillospiraceae bacterium]